MLHTHIVLQKRIYVSALISSGLMLTLLTLAFFPVDPSPSDTLAAPAPGETTLSMTAENINLNLSVDNPNGTFNTSAPAALSVETNNNSGYTLSISADGNGEDSTKLVNGDYEFNSIASAVSDSAGFNSGDWGLKPSKLDSIDNTDFIPAPTSGGVTLDETDEPSVSANEYTIVLGAKADYSLPAGRYSNTFVVQAIGNMSGRILNFVSDDQYKDYSVQPEGMPEAVTGEPSDQTLTIPSNIPTDGNYNYAFRGWCDGTITENDENDNTICAGTVYKPGNSYNMGSSSEKTLYAMWGSFAVTGILDGNGADDEDTADVDTISLWVSDSETTIVCIYDETYHKEGYYISGWDTDPAGGDGDVTFDGNCFNYTLSNALVDPITFYAQWDNTYAIRYEYLDQVMEGQVGTLGTPVTLRQNTFINEGYIFDGWEVYEEGYGSDYTLNAEGTELLVTELTEGPVTIVVTPMWTSSFVLYYDGNGADSGSMYPYDVSIGEPFYISSNEYTRDGYIFVGWNTRSDGSGDSYGDEAEVIIAPEPGQRTVTLYAQWYEPSGQPDYTSQGGTYTQSVGFREAYQQAYAANNKLAYVKQPNENTYHQIQENETIAEGADVRYSMQDINLTYQDNGKTRSVCDAVTIENDSYQAVDIRDSKLYWILKATDGKCWMTQNLDLDLDSNTELSSLDTDLKLPVFTERYSSGYSLRNNVVYWKPAKSTTNATLGAMTNDDSNIEARSTDVGDWYYTDQHVASAQQNYLEGNAGSYFSQTPFADNGTHGHVGNYYNYSAAIASNGYENDYDYYSQNSICPAGWRLPNVEREDVWDDIRDENSISHTWLAKHTPTIENEFYSLLYEYGGGSLYDSASVELSPLFFTRAGTVRRGSLGNAGYDGYYWSSQYFEAERSYLTNYNFLIRYDSLDVVNNITTDRQRSIRCVARSQTNNNQERRTVEIRLEGSESGGSPSCAPSVITVREGSTAKMRSNVDSWCASLDNTKSFAFWSTEWDGSGETFTDYIPATVTDGSVSTIYAQYR